MLVSTKLVHLAVQYSKPHFKPNTFYFNL